MSIKLDWQIGDDDDQPSERKRRRWPISSVGAIIAAALVAAVVLGGYGYNRNEAAKSKTRLIEAVQEVLDIQRQAYLEGDGDLFFASQDREPSWTSAQLRPENQALYQAELKVTDVQNRGDTILANISWPYDGKIRQRIAFFERHDDTLIRVPTMDDYWKDVENARYNWGTLNYHENDEMWVDDIAAFVEDVITEICQPGSGNSCSAGSYLFTLTISADYQLTAETRQIRIPSPRLLALDEDGQPDDLFWQRLRQEIKAQLTPAHIRFAVPVESVDRDLRSIYERLALEFSESHPNITVEIVSLADLSGDPLVWPLEVDGAAYTPSEEMIAAGTILDLSDFVNSDLDFDRADFYEQMWQSAFWQGRMWFMPQAADMRLLFYNKESYRQSDLMEPSMRWTWEEMNDHINVLSASQPENGRSSKDFIFMDTGRDALFSFAYNRNNNCPEAVTVRCQRQLKAGDVAATLDWYRQLAGELGVMPDLTVLSPSERERMMFNYHASIWVDSPVRYEFRLLMNPIGVVPFPGSDRFDGITPLWVGGSFISQHSQQPLAMWEWLKFLSYQHLQRQLRMIPARPSVAAQSGYWNILPRPLGDAMRTAFPFAQPVSLEDQGHFSWSQLADVVSGGQSPTEAAQSTKRARWFGQETE